MHQELRVRSGVGRARDRVDRGALLGGGHEVGKQQAPGARMLEGTLRFDDGAGGDRAPNHRIAETRQHRIGPPDRRVFAHVYAPPAPPRCGRGSSWRPVRARESYVR